MHANRTAGKAAMQSNGTGSTLQADERARLDIQDRESEMIVLAGIMIDPDVRDAAIPKLEPADFADGRHRDVFMAMLALWEAQQPTDQMLVADELEKRHGWSAQEVLYLFELPAYSRPTNATLVFVPRLKDATHRRRLLSVAQSIAQQAYDGPSSAEAQAYAEKLLADVKPAEVATDDAGDVDERNPLERAPGAGAHLDLGWVDRYAKVMTHLTGAPFEFNRLCGLVTAAAAIQRRAVLRMSFGDIYPNLYACIVAPTSVFHKSTALDQVPQLLRRAQLDALLLANDMTAEGLVRQLQSRPAGLIVNHEIGRIFNSHNVKYLANLKPNLTDSFDCKPFIRRLSAEEIRIDAPYLNILGATTPSRFFEGVSLTDWQDGFLARWLFVLPEGEPDFDAVMGLFTEDHDRQIGDIAVKLASVNRQHETAFIFAGDAFKLWDSWAREGVKAAYYFGDDAATGFVSRYNVYALKLALILAAVNDSWGTITPATMQTAMDLADSFKRYAYRLLSEKADYGVSGAKLQKVFAIVKRRGGTAGVTRKIIMQFTKMRAGDVTLCIEKLLEVGAIIEDSTGRAPRYAAIAEQLPVKVWR